MSTSKVCTAFQLQGWIHSVTCQNGASRDLCCLHHGFCSPSCSSPTPVSYRKGLNGCFRCSMEGCSRKWEITSPHSCMVFFPPVRRGSCTRTECVWLCNTSADHFFLLQATTPSDRSDSYPLTLRSGFVVCVVYTAVA